MKQKTKKVNKTYRSILEVEKEFFPTLYSKRVAQIRESTKVGTGLVPGLIEGVTQELNKKRAGRSKKSLQTALASEAVLCQDWDKPEEDTAWENL